MGVPTRGKGSDGMSTESAISRAVQTLVLSLVLFALAFGAHEVMHLLVLYAVGGHGSIIVRPWRMGTIDASIGSLHVQPDQPIAISVHDCFIARQFELDGNADRLVAAIAKQFDVPLFRHWASLLAYARDICHNLPDRKRSLHPAVDCPVSRSDPTG